MQIGDNIYSRDSRKFLGVVHSFRRDLDGREYVETTVGTCFWISDVEIYIPSIGEMKVIYKNKVRDLL